VKGLVLPLSLQLIGMVVVIAEVILPSGGLLSLLAMGIFAYSLHLVFGQFGQGPGLLLVGLDLVLIPVLVVACFRLLARSPMTLRAELKREDGVSSQAPELADFLGLEGRTVTPLRPAGAAIFSGRRLDVVSRGEFLEKDTQVKVIAVTGNQIIVKAKEE